MKLSRKISQYIAAAFIVALIVLLLCLLPLQRQKQAVLHKNITSLMQNFITKDMGPLANAIFENRKRSVNLRVAEIVRIEGIRQAFVFDALPTLVSDALDPPDIHRLRPYFIEALKNGQTIWHEQDSLWYLQSIRAFDEIIGYILVEYSLADLNRSESIGLMTVIGLISLLMLILVLVSSHLIQRIILKPVRDLIAQMGQIQEGRYGGQIQVTSRDEIGFLAIRFNAMSREIADSYHQIEEQNRRLSTTKNLLDNIIESLPAMLVIVDREIRILDWNRAAARRTGTGIEDARGRRLGSVFPLIQDQVRLLETAVTSRTPRKLAKIETALDDANYVLDITVYPVAADDDTAVIIIDDITDAVRMEAVMIQTEKMMSVGGLAAGMAHEINNPLAGMIQNAQVIQNRLMEKLPANRSAARETGLSLDRLLAYMERREIPHLLTALRRSGERAAQIVRNMLSFSRQANQGFTREDLASLVDDTIDLAENDYDLKKKFDFKSLTVTREYEPGMTPVSCERSKIQQVILNLLKNSAQAMADRPPDSPELVIRLNTRQGMACIDIQDNGPGMSASVRKRVFEPFFTTKAVGEGTGLGLSVAYFIVTENHHGQMSVESTPGRGTTFFIRLPFSHESRNIVDP